MVKDTRVAPNGSAEAGTVSIANVAHDAVATAEILNASTIDSDPAG